MRKASYPPLITELPYATLTQLHRDRINVLGMSAFRGKADIARLVLPRQNLIYALHIGDRGHPMDGERKDVWASGDAYERYVGRWSRLVAHEFVPWLGVPPNSKWLDIGCGTGVLCQVIVDSAAPRQVMGIDPSDGFVSFARHKVTDPRATFQVGDGQELPVVDGSFDATVAGLVINFVPDQAKAVREMKRATRPGARLRHTFGITAARCR